MKKLILGLLLTVCVSGMSFANAIKEMENNNSILNVDEQNRVFMLENNFLAENLTEMQTLDCHYSIVQPYEDCGGITHNLILLSTNGECGSNEEGSLVIKMMPKVVGNCL